MATLGYCYCWEQLVTAQASTAARTAAVGQLVAAQVAEQSWVIQGALQMLSSPHLLVVHMEIETDL